MLLAAAATAGPVAAPERALSDSALAANGECQFQAEKDSNNCYHVTRYIQADTGRTTFFIQGLGMLSFTGMKLTNALGRQELEVDGVSYGYNGGPPPKPATGSCEAMLSEDGKTFLSVACHAKSLTGAAYEFTFTSDGTPAYAVPTPRRDASADAAALTALRSAAEAGDLKSQVRLGAAYETADGAPEDLAGAARLLRAAADRGSPEAMRRLGELHRFGLGVSPDRAEALRWYRLAADHGDAEAMFHLGEMIGENDADEDTARDWYRRSAEGGFARSMVQIATSTDDFAETRRWLEKAVALGHSPAMKELGERLARQKDGLPGDQAESRRLLKLADTQEWNSRLADGAAGDRTAMYLLGAAFDGGFVFPRDAVQAVRWYRMAAERGDPVAMGELADHYEQGDGVAKDVATAKTWRDRSNTPETKPEPSVPAEKVPKQALPAGDPTSMPVEQLTVLVEHLQPAAFFILSKRLMDLGRTDEAVFWFYVGQLRWQAYLINHPSQNEGELFGAMVATLGPPLNDYIGGDVQAWVAMIDKVLAWDASHPDDFTASRDARARSRAGMIDLRQQIINRQDEVRAARTRRGLTNRNTAHVDQGSIPAPAQSEHMVGGKTVSEVFQDPKAAALARSACSPDAATLTAQAVAGGADPKTVGLLGATPLFWAFSCQNLTGMEALLKAGADPNYAYPGGASVVFSAASLPDPSYLKLLLRFRGDPNAAEYDGSETALMKAMSLGLEDDRWENYDTLLAAGADINRSNLVTSVATMAADRGRLDKVIDLLDRGYSHDLETLGFSVEHFSDPQNKDRARVITMLQARGVHFPTRAIMERGKTPGP
jgi:TPR repeat protein